MFTNPSGPRSALSREAGAGSLDISPQSLGTLMTLPEAEDSLLCHCPRSPREAALEQDKGRKASTSTTTQQGKSVTLTQSFAACH